MGSTLASDVAVSLVGSLITFPVNVTSAGKSDKRQASGGTKLICPTCSSGVGQRYICDGDDHHGPFTQDELHRGRVIGDTVVPVTDEEIAGVRGGTASKKHLALHVWPAAQFDTWVRPAGLGCRLVPPTKGPAAYRQGYAILLELASQPGVVLAGELNVRSEKLYRLEVVADAAGNRQLWLVEMARPDDVNPLDEIGELPELDEAHRQMAADLARQLLADFDPAMVRNTARERAAALDAAKAGQPGVPVAGPVEAPAAGADLMALLAASIDATKAA